MLSVADTVAVTGLSHHTVLPTAGPAVPSPLALSMGRVGSTMNWRVTVVSWPAESLAVNTIVRDPSLGIGGNGRVTEAENCPARRTDMVAWASNPPSGPEI